MGGEAKLVKAFKRLCSFEDGSTLWLPEGFEARPYIAGGMPLWLFRLLEPIGGKHLGVMIEPQAAARPQVEEVVFWLKNGAARAHALTIGLDPGEPADLRLAYLALFGEPGETQGGPTLRLVLSPAGAAR